MFLNLIKNHQKLNWIKHAFTLLVSLRQCNMALISNLDLNFSPQLGYLISFI